jgi:hypothetical protein
MKQEQCDDSASMYVGLRVNFSVTPSGGLGCVSGIERRS